MPSSTSNFKRALSVAGLMLATLVLGNVVLYRVFHEDNFLTMAARNIGPDRSLVFFGSSRLLYGIDPAQYPWPNVSIAANYLDLVSARELYEVHADALGGMKVAVVELDVATLTYDTAAMNPYGLLDLGQRQVAPLRDWVRHFDASLHRVLAAIFNWRLTPSFAEGYAMRTIAEKEPLDAAPGFIPSTVTMAYPEFHAASDVQATTEEMAVAGEAVQQRNLDAAVALVTGLRARGVRVVLLRFPLEPALRKLYPPAWHELVQAKHLELGRRVGGAPPELWDYSRDEAFLPEEFRDSDHLNKRGAARLAAVLTPRLQALLK